MQSTVPADVPVDDRVCLALHAAARAVDAVYRPLLDGLGLTYPQFSVLSVLWEDGPQQVSELTRRLCLDSSTMSPLLKRLEANGLLTRGRDPLDERRVVVSLTLEGKETRKGAIGITRRICAATGLDDDAQADLVTRLRTLAATLAQSADTI